MQFTAAIVLALSASLASAGVANTSPNMAHAIQKRLSFPIPASKGSVTYKTAKSISGTFDGGMKTYGRGVSCTGQAEGGDSDAVFLLEDGATLQNAIIGKDQIEGVHCKGACTIKNVWWAAVCEGKSISALQYENPLTTPLRRSYSQGRRQRARIRWWRYRCRGQGHPAQRHRHGYNRRFYSRRLRQTLPLVRQL